MRIRAALLVTLAPLFLLLWACHRDTNTTFEILRGPYLPPPTIPTFLSFTDAETPQQIAFSPQSILLATDGGLVVVERETHDAVVMDEQSGLAGHNLTEVLRVGAGANHPAQTWVAGAGFVSRYEQKWDNMPGPPEPVGLVTDPTQQGVLVAARTGFFRSAPKRLTTLSSEPLNASQQNEEGAWLATNGACSGVRARSSARSERMRA
jgi:hypothetical protein